MHCEPSEVGAIGWLYLCLFIFWMVYLYFVKDYGYWEQRKVPHVGTVFPFGSLTKAVVSSNYKKTILDQVYKDFKGKRFVGFINIREPCLLLRDTELIKDIMTDHFDYFVDRTWLDINPKDSLSVNIATKSGREWREMRSKLNPAYDGAHLSNMFGLLWTSSDLLLQAVNKQIDEGNYVDVKETLTQFSMKLFAAWAFGTDINSRSKEDEEFYRVCQKSMDTDLKIKLKLFIYFAFPIVSKLHFFNMMDSEISKTFERKIRSTVQFRESTKLQKSDFLNLLIKVKNNECILSGCETLSKDRNNVEAPQKEGLTIKDIVSETNAFFTFGNEKTSVVLQFCLYELACNESIQERLFEEVQEVFRKYNNDLKCSSALDEMIYLDQVVNETLRHYPVTRGRYRKCTRDFKIPNSDLVIEKGLRLMIPVYSINHDSKYFSEPYTFNPDRFSAENCQKRPPWTFLPFGIGPRNCLGFRFGVMTVKLAVARLVANFKLSPTPDTPIPLQFTNESYLTKPLKPIKLIFTKR